LREHRLPAVAQRRLLCIGEMSSKAVATVHGARTGRDDERAALVLVQEPRRGTAVEIANRVRAEARSLHQLRGARQNLQQQRIARIAVAHACDIAAGYAQWEIP